MLLVVTSTGGSEQREDESSFTCVRAEEYVRSTKVNRSFTI